MGADLCLMSRPPEAETKTKTRLRRRPERRTGLPCLLASLQKVENTSVLPGFSGSKLACFSDGWTPLPVTSVELMHRWAKPTSSGSGRIAVATEIHGGSNRITTCGSSRRGGSPIRSESQQEGAADDDELQSSRNRDGFAAGTTELRRRRWSSCAGGPRRRLLPWRRTVATCRCGAALEGRWQRAADAWRTVAMRGRHASDWGGRRGPV